MAKKKSRVAELTAFQVQLIVINIDLMRTQRLCMEGLHGSKHRA